MDHRTPMVRRPVRAAAIVASGVALVGSGAAFIPGIAAPAALCFALVYGPILGWYVVGVVLAFRFRVTRWWWVGSVFPFMCMAFLALGFERWPEAVVSRWPVVGGVSLLVIVSWLSVGCLLAFRGWWSYARRHRAVTDA
ncbi:MAG: hypothetical protein HY682_06300 [Chloroflexi bacterium]|nr:hypothetical protein [Chloroflexota bacterium]